MSIVYRQELGRELTWSEADNNFAELKAGVDSKKSNFDVLPVTQGGTGQETVDAVKVAFDIATKTELASSAAGKGAELVEYQGATVESALNERLPEIGNYAGLDAYTGDATAVLVYGVANIFDGGAGIFRRTTDTPAAANGIYRQDALGRWWKRDYSGTVNARWFGAAPGLLDHTASVQAAVNYVKSLPLLGIVYLPGQQYTWSVISCDKAISIIGDGKEKTKIAGRIEIVDNDYSGGENDVVLQGFSIGGTTTAILLRGWYGARIDDVKVAGCTADGIRLESTYATRITDFQGGGCGTVTSGSAVIRWVRTTSGNTLFVDRSYISGSIGSDGIKTDALQVVSVSNTIIESVDTGVRIGTVGTTTRTVSLRDVYFENVAVSCGEFYSVAGVTLEDIYTNHQGPRSPYVKRSFLFDTCDMIRGDNLRLDFPAASYGNTDFLAPIEFNTFGIDWINADVEFKRSSNMDKVCVNNNGASRKAINTMDSHLGIEGVAPPGFAYSKASTNQLPNPDITAWAVTGAGSPSVSKSAGAFYDGGDLFTISATSNSGYALTHTTSVAAGSAITFAALCSGTGRLRVRGRRSSDNVYEDVGAFYFSFESGNATYSNFKIVCISVHAAANAYNQLQYLITTSTSCKISKPKVVFEKMPGKMTA